MSTKQFERLITDFSDLEILSGAYVEWDETLWRKIHQIIDISNEWPLYN